MEAVGYLTSNMFRIYLIYKFFRVFFAECKISKRKELFAYVVYYCVNSCMYLAVCIPIVTFMSNVFGMLAISFIYKTTTRQRLFCMVLQCALMVSTEMITTYLFVGVFPVPMHKNLPNLTVTEYVVTNLSSYPVILFMDKCKRKKQGEEVPLLYWVMLVLLPVSSIYISMLLCMSQWESRIWASFGALCLLGVNLIAFSLYDNILVAMHNKVEEAKIQEQNYSYERQLVIYQESVEKAREMRHSWKNHLAVISNLAKSSKDESVVQYVSSLIDSLDSRKIYSTSGNPAVDAIVNYKCEEAEKCGISVMLSMQISSNIRIEAMDISMIIGNLMDNAIRAAKSVKNNSYIHLTMKESQGSLSIRIINPYKENLKILDGMYQTTKEKKEEHGIGLAHVKKIVDKYNGTLKIDSKQKVFRVDVILFE